MQLAYIAPENVRAAIGALGRTEDVRFSPNNRRLALASFLRNQITVFEIGLADSSREGKISITDATVISSAHLKQPHGLDFIDDATIIVANRLGDVTIFELPSGGGNHELAPLEIIRSGDVVDSPGNVSITRGRDDLCEALICNNLSNKVTRHLLDLTDRCVVKKSEILLRKWLDVPNGVSVSGPWIAISSYNNHSVFLYDSSVPLSENSEPDGILRCNNYPHGLRFTSDGRFILVADAGGPYVHIYTRDGSGWRGVRGPAKSIRILSDEDFIRGRTNVDRGGPKGLDIDSSMSTLVTTCEIQPLAFFDLAKTLEWLSLIEASGASGLEETLRASYERHCQDQRSLEIRYELERQQAVEREAVQLRQALAAVTNTKSWRYTAPLRAIYGFLRRLA